MDEESLEFLNKFKANNFEDIIHLDLNNNIKTTSYYQYFPKLINLKCLILSNNIFDVVPPIDSLKSLEELYVRNVQITNTSTQQQLSIETTKAFITKIKNLVNLKHYVCTGSKFDAPTINDYIIYYLNNLETLNFKKITTEQREISILNIQKIREKQQQQQQQQKVESSKSKILSPTSPISSPLANNLPPSIPSSSSISSPLSKNSSTPTPSSPLTKNTPLSSPSSSVSKKKVNFNLTIQSSPNYKQESTTTTPKTTKPSPSPSPQSTPISKLTNVSTPKSSVLPTPKTISTNITSRALSSSKKDKVSNVHNYINNNNNSNNKSNNENIIQAIRLLINNISSVEDLKTIEDAIKEKMKTV